MTSQTDQSKYEEIRGYDVIFEDGSTDLWWGIIDRYSEEQYGATEVIPTTMCAQGHIHQPICLGSSMYDFCDTCDGIVESVGAKPPFRTLTESYERQQKRRYAIKLLKSHKQAKRRAQVN